MSKYSSKRNIGANGSKSVGKPSSVSGNSFTRQKVSEANMGITAKSGTSGQMGPNIVIDIESENLTYN